jgi:hypothetical protein
MVGDMWVMYFLKHNMARTEFFGVNNCYIMRCITSFWKLSGFPAALCISCYIILWTHWCWRSWLQRLPNSSSSTLDMASTKSWNHALNSVYQNWRIIYYDAHAEFKLPQRDLWMGKMQNVTEKSLLNYALITCSHNYIWLLPGPV